MVVPLAVEEVGGGGVLAVAVHDTDDVHSVDVEKAVREHDDEALAKRRRLQLAAKDARACRQERASMLQNIFFMFDCCE